MRKSHQKRSVMGEQNQVQKIEKYNENKVVRVSQELYQLDKIRWRMSTLGYRLLFAISQSVSSIEEEILPDVGFDKQSLFKYLGLDNNNDKYNRLAETLAEVGQNMLQFATKKKNGAQVWQGYTWITAYNLAMDEKYVQICINPKVRQFLMQLNKYACIQPKYYLKLSSDYQNWFYPYFKNYVKLHQWKVSIDDLKNALELTESPTYDPKKNKNANERFLSDVIGIRINDKVKAEQRAAKAEKRTAKLIEWDYVTDKNTKKVTGTLAAISQFTDINANRLCRQDRKKLHAPGLLHVGKNHEHKQEPERAGGSQEPSGKRHGQAAAATQAECQEPGHESDNAGYVQQPADRRGNTQPGIRPHAG